MGEVACAARSVVEGAAAGFRVVEDRVAHDCSGFLPEMAQRDRIPLPPPVFAQVRILKELTKMRGIVASGSLWFAHSREEICREASVEKYRVPKPHMPSRKSRRDSPRGIGGKIRASLRVSTGNRRAISGGEIRRDAPLRMTWAALGCGEREGAKALRVVPSANICDVT
jgi:hypothetical protein